MTDESQQTVPKVCRIFDGIIDWCGKYFSWLYVVLIIVIIVQVILRYVFGRGSVILEELQFHLYGITIILAISYTLVHDGHIRLDLFHSHFKRRNKEKVEFFGIIFMLFPMLLVIFYHSLGFVAESWHVSERSISPLGLCCRWAFKFFIPVGITLAAMAAVSRLIKAFVYLKRNPKGSQ